MGLHKKMGLQLLRCSQETSKERSTAGPAPWQQEVSQGEKMCDCIHQSQYTIRMYVKMQVKQIQISLSLYIYISYIYKSHTYVFYIYNKYMYCISVYIYIYVLYKRVYIYIYM